MRRWIVPGVLLALVAVLVAWFLMTYERVSEERRMPPTGEAARNPMYALRLALQASGERARTQRWFRPAQWRPAARDTLVMYGQAAPFSAAETARLLGWVRGGGHLVLPMRTLTAAPALSQALGLELRTDAGGCFSLPAPTKKKDAKPAGKPGPKPPIGFGEVENIDRDVMLCGARVDGLESALGGTHARGGAAFARITLGAGRVTLASGLDFLANDELERPLAAELAYQALAPNMGQGEFVLVYGDDMPSLMRLLLTHGWMVIVPALLALLAWLLLRGQRFGTPRPAPPGHRRALLEHVQAAGEFAYRRGKAYAMHAALRQRFDARLARRDPSLAALEGDARVVALAERCRLPASRVREALFPRDLHRADAFFHSMSTLALMRLRV
jgi:hypothetical protein